MKFKGDYMRSGKKNVDKDPWVELGPIVWISRLVGQGPGGTIINIYITIMAITEATISFTWILFVGHHSKNTLSRVTEDGQVLILYLSASWSALNAVLWREDDKIMTLLKGFPLEGKYNPWSSYKKIALKLILLAPVMVSIWLLSRELIKYIQTGLNLDFITHSFYLLATISIHLIELWSLVSSADNFSKSAETFTRNLFTAAIEDDTEILAEMDVVKSHIASSKESTITAFGFLSVDYSLICGMLGAITTYMVIIVQIGNVEE
ncbi:uncharacterized protein isoform X2 [Rhodnius prolixus]|uniref:uncharacterized protein isoform X2 n=1 Tax=Rhodnius prolixus TaxID=13249 RepID=UPI003D18E912